MGMIRIEGHDLEGLVSLLTNPKRKVYLLRVDVRGDQVAFKINESMWTHPMGTVQEPY